MMHSLTPHTKFLLPLTQVAKACYHLCPQVTVSTEETESLMAVSLDVTPGKCSIVLIFPYLICWTESNTSWCPINMCWIKKKANILNVKMEFGSSWYRQQLLGKKKKKKRGEGVWVNGYLDFRVKGWGPGLSRKQTMIFSCLSRLDKNLRCGMGREGRALSLTPFRD